MDNNKKTPGASHLKKPANADADVPEQGHSSVAEKPNAPNPAGTASAVRGIGALSKTSGKHVTVGTSSEVHSDPLAQEGTPLSRSQRRKQRKAIRDKEWQESAKKRGREENSTPSPNIKGPVKRPRTEDSVPRSYSRALSGIKMAVAKRSHPKEKLSDAEVKLIHLAMDEAIDEIPPGGEGPQIHTCGLSGGALILNCVNEPTVKWLQSFFTSERMSEMGIVFIPALDLPKPVKIAFKTRDLQTDDSAKMLRRLQLLNPPLNTEEWKTHNRSIVDDSYARWIFEIDQNSADVIRSKNLVLFAGSHGSGLVKILYDPQARNTETSKEKPPVETLVSTKTVETAGVLAPETVAIPPGNPEDTTEDMDTKEESKADAEDTSLEVSDLGGPEPEHVSPKYEDSVSGDSCVSISTHIHLLDFADSEGDSDATITGSVSPKEVIPLED